MQRWNRRVVSNQKNKKVGRKHKIPNSAIEDVVSQFMVDKFHSNILNFAKNLQKKLGEDASLYAHGGYALYAAGQTKVAEVEQLMRKDDKFREALAPITTMPRDIDFSVLPRKGYMCNTFGGCMSNEIVKHVTGSLRDLRREIHNLIVDDIGSATQLMDAARNEVKTMLPSNISIEEMWIADTSHLHIERDRDKNAIVNRNDFRKPWNRCGADNMQRITEGVQPTARSARPKTMSAAVSARNQRRGQCFPLRDHLNATIEFTNHLTPTTSVTSDFVLCRLALGVGVRYVENGTQKTIEVPVNFVDVSIVRGNDSMYGGQQSVTQAPVVFRREGFLPYPSLQHITKNTVVQLNWNTQIVRDPSIDADTKEYTKKTIKKLENRLVAIALLQNIGVEAAVKAPSSRASTNGSLRRDDNDLSGAFQALTNAMYWLDPNAKDGVLNYIMTQLPYALGIKNRTPSPKGTAVTTNGAKTQDFSQSKSPQRLPSPKTQQQPTRNPRTGVNLPSLPKASYVRNFNPPPLIRSNA